MKKVLRKIAAIILITCSTQFLNAEKPQPLPNIGASCYLNSALQILFQMDGLNNFLRQHNLSPNDYPIVNTYLGLLNSVKDKNNLTAFKNKVTEKFKLSGNEDPVEFIFNFFNFLNEHPNNNICELIIIKTLGGAKLDYCLLESKTNNYSEHMGFEYQSKQSPEFLIININRALENSSKDTSCVTFPLLGLDYFNEKYDLVGFTMHSGSQKGGHHITCVQDTNSLSPNNCFLCNDTNISSINAESIAYTGKHETFTPQILVYHLRPEQQIEKAEEKNNSNLPDITKILEKKNKLTLENENKNRRKQTQTRVEAFKNRREELPQTQKPTLSLKPSSATCSFSPTEIKRNQNQPNTVKNTPSKNKSLLTLKERQEKQTLERRKAFLAAEERRKQRK